MSGHTQSDSVCWICLSSEGKPLVNPCQCPKERVVHNKCLASEEHECRFCHSVYPDWKTSLTPTHLKPAIPVVSVHHNGICYRLRVKPGQEGMAAFQRQLQRITGMPVSECMQITFQCKAPETAQALSFKGLSAFDAAIHCASFSAAERLAMKPAEAPVQACTASLDASPALEPGVESQAQSAFATQGAQALSHQESLSTLVESASSLAGHDEAGASSEPIAPDATLSAVTLEPQEEGCRIGKRLGAMFRSLVACR